MTSHTHTNQILGFLLSAILLIGSALVISSVNTHIAKGANSGVDDPVTQYATSSSVWVGKDIPTIVAQSSSGRSYLEISNISGATSTPTSVYCNVGRSAFLARATVYKGIFINGSSTRIWGRGDSVPTGFVSCVSATASSTVTVVEK